MSTIHYRKTPRTLPEAFGAGATLYVEPRILSTVRAARMLAARATKAALPFFGAAAVGVILYVAFVIGVTR